MSLSTVKSGIDTIDREMTNLPELPSLPSLKPDEQAALNLWWRRAREAFRRMEDDLRIALNKTGG